MADDYDFRMDPRLEGMGLNEQRTLYPDEMPKPGESRYLILDTDVPSGGQMVWENDPDGYYWGLGRGLPKLDEAARFRHSARKSQITQPEIWPREKVYLITKRMLDLINEYDPKAIEARPADFLFSDDLSPDEPYYLADFVQNIDAVDFGGSIVNCRTSDVSNEPRCWYSTPCMLNTDIALSAHIIRHAAPSPAPGMNGGGGGDIFFSREIVMEMVKRRFRRMIFRDPAIGPGQSQGDIIWVNGNGTGKPQ
jgi:Protein of unknown function (DUF1629)